MRLTEQTTPELPALPEVKSHKKLVLEHTQGSLKGIFRIFGCSDVGYPTELPPMHIGNDAEVGRNPIEFASLIAVRPRWVHYREVFDRSGVAGRLDDFHPKGPAPSFSPAQV